MQLGKVSNHLCDGRIDCHWKHDDFGANMNVNGASNYGKKSYIIVFIMLGATG